MKLVFPGSFDPITTGHMELIDRASKLSEQLYVVVEDNLQKNPPGHSGRPSLLRAPFPIVAPS